MLARRPWRRRGAARRGEGTKSGAAPEAIRELIRNASRHNWLVEAPQTPFAMNAALRERGYDWDADRKQRWRFVPTDEECEAEIDWLVNDVYGGAREPTVTRMTWRERYAMR